MPSRPTREDEEPAATIPFSSRASDSSDMAAMQEFIDEGAITEVLGVVKSGKEATVYRCLADNGSGERLLAAKVYHDSGHRSFKRATEYQDGRVIGSRTVRAAIAAKKDLGRQFEAALWVEHEFEVLSALEYAGADVPAVYAATEKAILMEYLGTDDGAAAPYLQHARMPRDEAARLFDRLLWNIELWLRENVVHGDLSPFNILYHDGRAVVIDFPQAVDPRVAPAARKLLQRDVRNVTQYFTRYGLEADGERIADDLWERFAYGWA